MAMHHPQDHYLQATPLVEASLDADPCQQFKRWFNEAKTQSPGDWFIPEAMTLATTDEKNKPSARIVLLKEFGDGGFIFFSHYQSGKGLALTNNPKATLSFYWGHVQRQIRIEGHIEKTLAKHSDEYFQSRPRESQLSAYCSKQSTVIPNYQYLENCVDIARQKFHNKIIPRPEQWGGYCLKPDYFEFWQGRTNRLHDRLIYSKNKNQWLIERLAP